MRATPVVVRLAAIVSLATAATLVIPRPGLGAKPAKEFPQFEAGKSGLGTLALVSDLIVVEDVIGTTEKVYVQDSRRMGQALADLMAETLESKGYRFGPKTVVSVGHVVNDRLQYRVLQTWDQHTENDSSFPVVEAPFYEDSALCSGEGARAAWHEVLNGTWAFKKKKNEPAPVLSRITELREPLGSDFAMVVVVVGTKIPLGKQLGQGLLSGLPLAGGRAGNVSFTAGVDFTQYSGTGIRLAVVDCRSGEVLWSDGDYERWSLDEERLGKLAKDVLKRMP